MDERLTEVLDSLSPAELDGLIGDLPLHEEPDREALERLRARVRGARPRRRRGKRLRRGLATVAAAVLAVVLLGNAGLFATAAQWAQSVLGLEAAPIQGFREDGTADFHDRRVDDTATRTLLVSEETEGVEYRVELSDLTFEEPRRGHWQTSPHAYIYLYVDGRTADSGELREGQEVVLAGGPGTCLLVVVSTVRAEITGTVTRIYGEVGP